MTGCVVTGNITKEPHEEHFNYTILFCGDCLEELKGYIDQAEDVVCALYNLDNSIADALERKKGLVITDAGRQSSGLMHNKFCVFDSRIVWTGSFNPTKRRNVIDDVIIINSTALAKNYIDEFKELKGNSSSRTTTTKIILNTTLIENYFCPEDGCISILQSKLAAANHSIYFATYSFTHPKIANELIIKSSSGIAVKGIIEKGSSYSQFQTLKSNNLAVLEDDKKRILHHKFFIIDGQIVITGSFNPTRNGNRRNDENMLIIHNEKVAVAYHNYFLKLFD